MKSAICERYGPPEVVRIMDVPKPTPKANEVRIKAHATTVSSGDARLRALRVPRGVGPLVRVQMGFFGPRQPVFGFDVAGEIEAVGENVTAFKPGDKVVASAGFDLACHAEYRCLPEDGAIAHMPKNLGYEETVALCFGASTALTFFKCGKLQRGETILVNGASGAVGTAAVQIAKHMGAAVTGVCSTKNMELVRSLGADRVIDYTVTDFTKSGETYDVIMDNFGNAPYSRVRGLLTPGGRFLMVIGGLGQMIQAAFVKQVINGYEGGGNGQAFAGDVMRQIVQLAEAGVLKPVIDRTYPFDAIVEAHRHVDGGHKVGSVVVTMDTDAA